MKNDSIPIPNWNFFADKNLNVRINAQCENFSIFLSLCRFFVKSILGIVEVQKLPF